MSVRVVIADDSPIFREVLEEELQADGDLVVVGAASDGREAIELSTARGAGGRIIAQDEDSSTVFGMPRAVAESTRRARVLAPPDIAQALVQACFARRRR